MTPSVRQPANELVLRYLAARQAPEDDRAPRPEQRDYWEAGSHPDVVARIWDQLGKNLPVDSRRVVCGAPALVHPGSKVLIAVAIGTAYVIRLPSTLVQSGVPETVRTDTVWSGGSRTDARSEFGGDWAFGSYRIEEEAWCHQSFDEHGVAGGAS